MLPVSQVDGTIKNDNKAEEGQSCAPIQFSLFNPFSLADCMRVCSSLMLQVFPTIHGTRQASHILLHFLIVKNSYLRCHIKKNCYVILSG